MNVSVPLVALDPELPLPTRAREGDAGVDLFARRSVVLARNGGRLVVPTGIAIAIPAGHGGLILPRSGLAAKHGVTVLNAPGLIDAGYRGEIQVPLINTDAFNDFSINRGDRIAQLVILPIPTVEWSVVASLPDTLGVGTLARGDGGYGSSGR